MEDRGQVSRPVVGAQEDVREVGTEDATEDGMEDGKMEDGVEEDTGTVSKEGGGLTTTMSNRWEKYCKTYCNE
jgi:hypothetical protein